MSKIKTIVIGGSGFLGSHVADALSAVGHEVVIYDLQPSPYLRDGQEMVVGDILDVDKLNQCISGCDYVYNFAGIADIDEASTHPRGTAMMNVVGNINVLEACRAADVKRYVYASTVYVYSESASFYRVSKQAAEQYIEVYHQQCDLDYTILRYGTLYGRRADKRNSVWRMLHDAIGDQKITYGGDPDSMREFIHVTDAARLSVDILGDDYRNRHIILTGSEKIRIKDFIRMISEILNVDLDVDFNISSSNVHYAMTPYRFNPKVGHKLVANDFVDLGQGLLDCLDEAAGHEKSHQEES